MIGSMPPDTPSASKRRSQRLPAGVLGRSSIANTLRSLAAGGAKPWPGALGSGVFGRLRILGTGLALVVLGGCANAYRDFTDKSTDRYIIDQAKQSLDALKFDETLTQILPLFERRPTDPEIAYLASAAYAGRGGLRILDLFMALASELGDKKLFEIFAEHYVGADEADIADLESAVSVLERYGATAIERNTDMNFYALFLYYSRIGIMLNRYAYDAAGSKRGNFRVCHTQESVEGAMTGLPHAAVDRVMTTIPRIVETIPFVGGSGIAEGALDMSALGEFPREAYPCAEHADLTQLLDEGTQKCLAVRVLVGSDQLGLNTGEASGCLPGYTP